MNVIVWGRIGWRNLGRNRRRSLVTAVGLGAGYFAVVFLIGWVDGITAELVENATGLVSGQIEIHSAEYRPERSLYDTIGGRDGADLDALIATVDADPAVLAAAPRAYAGGLISSGEATLAGMLMGVDTVRELALSRFLDELSAGRLPVPGQNELVVGEEMARQLEAGVGDQVVVVTQGADGSVGNDLFDIAGIFHTGLNELDTSFAVMPIEDLQRLVVLDPGRVHEISVATADAALAPETATRLASALAPAGLDLDVAPWTELRPELAEYVALAQTFYGVVFFIVFLVALFGVANTMLMATFERRREFAVLLALGTTPVKVVLVVIAEAVALGLLSLAVGAAVTFPLMAWWHAAPPDLSWLYGELTMFGALMRPTLRVEITPAIWIWGAVALLATAVVAALYPAAKSARIPPADILSGL